MCQQGLTTLCTTITSKENIGWAWPGGFAEQVVAPPEENLMYLEPGVDAKMGVLLLDTLGTPFHGLRAVNAAEAKAAFVAGCGAVGLGVICVLKSLGGIPKVYASDRPGFRLNELRNSAPFLLTSPRKIRWLFLMLSAESTWL